MLPQLPKLLSVQDIRDLQALARRTGEWASAAQDLLRALRNQAGTDSARIAALEAAPSGGGAGVSDHGALTGLSDDDHTQYLLATGARALTGNQSAGSNKITSLAAATANGDALRYEQVAAARAVWDARVVPAGLHAHSDEFTTDTNANWSTWDEGPAIAGSGVDTTKRYLYVDGTGPGAGLRFAARYKAIPSNEFTFLAFVGVDGETGTFSPSAGLIVLQNGGAAGTDHVFQDLTVSRNGSIGGIVEGISTGFTTLGTNSTREVQGFTGIWLRMRVTVVPATSTTVEMDWSSDGGKNWAHNNIRSTAYAAQHYGFCFRATAASSQRCTVQHFRVFDTVTGFYDVHNGGYLAT